MKNSKILLWRNFCVALIITLLFVYLLNSWSKSTDTITLGKNYAANGGSCLACHNQYTPGIVKQYGDSKHAANRVSCLDCHSGKNSGKLAVNHNGNLIVYRPTPRNCSKCHPKEYQQFDKSRHSAPAWYAQTGSTAFTDQQLKRYGLPMTGKYNDLFNMEGAAITKMGCEVCHGIGKPNTDDSYGDCSKCHLSHNFSLAQARKPEICGSCHLGPDHPQKEIYEESLHGVLYAHKGDNWNWNATPGTLSSKNFDAPTCAICHISAFGSAPGTHNVGERLSWKLTPAQAEKRQEWASNRGKMKTICLECHSTAYIATLYENADKVVLEGNKNVSIAQNIIKKLKAEKKIPSAPFSSSFDFKGFEIWHHEGRRMRFGAFMNGPDYVQWHGIYEQMLDLTQLKEWNADVRSKVYQGIGKEK